MYTATDFNIVLQAVFIVKKADFNQVRKICCRYYGSGYAKLAIFKTKIIYNVYFICCSGIGDSWPCNVSH